MADGPRKGSTRVKKVRTKKRQIGVSVQNLP